MTAQSVVCGACSAEVPYGRLSCPSCGDLLASMARGRRRPTAHAGRMPQHAPLGAEPSASPSSLAAPASPSVAARHDLDAGLPWSSADEVAGTTDQRPAVAGPAALQATSAAASAEAFAAIPESLWDLSDPAVLDDPAPSARPAAVADAAPALTALGAPAFAGPGAYVPPPPVQAIAAMPAPARSWAGRAEMTGLASGPDAVSRTRRDRTPPVAADRRAPIAEFTGWLSVAGSALAAVGFLLPWGLVMIGSTGAGYFDRWGLAGPAHAIVTAALLAIIALAFVKNEVPPWIRVGLPGLGLGALLLGLVWPYLFGPLGSGPGALIVAVGAVGLMMSGVLALAADRHAEADRPV